MLLQLSIIIAFRIIGIYELAPEYVNSHGYSVFASDSFSCHNQALLLKDVLLDFRFQDWWGENSRFHTRLASFLYLFFGPIFGNNILCIWPLNAFCLFFSWKAWLQLISSLGGTKTPSSWHWCLFPSIILHFTQLLRDPLYILFFLMWLNAWIAFFQLEKNKSLYKSVILVLLISPFLFWVRERFWVLAQVMSLSWLLYALILTTFKRKGFQWFACVLFMTLVINSNSIYKIALKVMNQEISEVRDPELKDKPFTYFYKIASLRNDFIKSYQNASSLDHEVHFESDQDVIQYIPRALQISFFMPFPDMWFSNTGKTGKLGKILSAYEMVLIWSILCVLIYKSYHRRWTSAHLICLSAILISYLALGLVVTNGGALYRMRFASWLIWAALMFSFMQPFLSKHNSVKLEVANKE